MRQRLSQRIQTHWLWLGVNLAALLPLFFLGKLFNAAPISAGPVMFTEDVRQEIILWSGKIALVLLVLSLACTPVARILGVSAANKVRKSLGLWGFFYACFHALFFLEGKQIFVDPQAWRDFGQTWAFIQSTLFDGSKVPYAEAGIYALILIAPLAFTSNRLAMRLLGKNWKRLHRLIYLAVPVAIYHYWWRQEVMKAVETPLYWHPVTFAVVVGLLLLVRVPPVRRWLAARLSLARWRKPRKSTNPLTKLVIDRTRQKADPIIPSPSEPPLPTSQAEEAKKIINRAR